MLGSHHLNWVLGELRRSHAIHGTSREVTLGHGPLVEGVQAPVAVVGGGRLPAGELVGDERWMCSRSSSLVRSGWPWV
jgi:hypothetical protein